MNVLVQNPEAINYWHYFHLSINPAHIMQYEDI